MKLLRVKRGIVRVRRRHGMYVAAVIAVAALAVYLVPGASAKHRGSADGSGAAQATTPPGSTATPQDSTTTSQDPTTIAFRKSPPAIFSCMTGVLDNTGVAGPSTATIGPGPLGTVTATVNLRNAVRNSLYLVELVQTNGVACIKLNFTFVTTNAAGNATTTVDDFRVTNRAFVFASGGGDLEITPAVSSVT
jgi:hypothetical protein